MLVLHRNCGQSIVIGKNAEIIVKILRNQNGTISIGVDAPKLVQVDRLEIYEKRLQEDVLSTNDHKLALFNRLEIFTKRMKNSTHSNDPILKLSICPS